MGRKKNPVFALVAADSRSPRDGRYIEDLGRFYPVSSNAELTLNRERILYWLQQGAQPSHTVRNILRKEGVMLELHLLRKGAEAEEITAQVEAHRTRWAEKAAAVQAESPEDRRKKALEAERKAAAEERKRIEAERQEREAELEKQRKEAEEAERAAAAEALQAEKEDAEAAEATPSDAPVTEEEAVGTRRAVSSSEDEKDAESEEAPVAEAVQAEPEAVEEQPEVIEETVEEAKAELVEESEAEAVEATEAESIETEPETEAAAPVEEAEETSESEPAEEASSDATPDKLTDVWGIGPKYASILNDAGVQTFSTLAEKSVEDLQKIITDAGSTTAGNEETWAEQASLLAKGDKKGHDALVEKLKAG